MYVTHPIHMENCAEQLRHVCKVYEEVHIYIHIHTDTIHLPYTRIHPKENRINIHQLIHRKTLINLLAPCHTPSCKVEHLVW